MGDAKSVLLGVSGGIAAYKSAEIARALRVEGYVVQAVMTLSATKFITPLTLASLTGRKVITDLFPDGSADATLDSAIEHIQVAQEADLLLVAPATANVLAKFALGLADDFLSTAHLAFEGPLVLAPAMNTRMWDHPATRDNLATVRSRGAIVVEPGTGELACGTTGPGRLAETETILAAVRHALRDGADLGGECVLVTAGPTREALDPVRFLSNRSSGRMGYAIAAEAARRGARVILVSGPVELPTPQHCERVDVETAAEMHSAVMARLEEASIAVMAAAVADYRPASLTSSKLKRRDGVPSIELEETRDILKAVCERRGGTVVVGFAAETDDLESNARRKLVAKGCDMIVANPVGGSTGFDVDINQGLLLHADGAVDRLEPMSKGRMAAKILDATVAFRRRKAA